MSRSKLCMLSSATVHFDFEESNATQLTTIESPQEDTKNTDHDLTTEPEEETSNIHQNTITKQNSTSFQDDLISHFERRMSDLGPRNKYPYLQQLDEQQALIASSANSKSVEVLSKVRVHSDKGRGRWSKYAKNSH